MAAQSRRSTPTHSFQGGITYGFGPIGKAATGRHGIAKAAATGVNPFQEIGRTGLRQWGGYVIEEWLAELQGKRGAEFYREMSDSDPIIGGILTAIEVMVRKVTWWIEPASTDPADIEAQELIQGMLFEDLENSWSDTISEILSFLPYGYHLAECVYKRRNGDSRDPTKRSMFTDGRIGIGKLATRSQDSLLHWDFDDHDDWQAFVQQPPPTYSTYRIPREKALLFRTKVHKGNPEGRSVLRNCAAIYHYKKNVMAVQGIGVERDLAGLPVLTPPENVDIWNTNAPEMATLLTNAQAFVGQVRRDEMEGVVKPFGWLFELLKGGGSRSFNTLDIVRYCDEVMARSLLADVITMGGDKATGSYALSDNKKDLFNGAIESHLDQIASVFNTDGIPRVYRLNGMPAPNGYARLCHGAAEQINLSTIAEALQAAAAAGAPLFAGDGEDKLLNWFLDKIGAPSMDASEDSDGE